ncbi:PadR family transcriptional regulator [Streptomyces sp. HSW2009]|uniref:PadR family transcriptional regulator n=1 Tax=Streptomyces sp. HSW2009 TaxID=3142890 RepID=UPI0032EEC0EB
MSAMRLLVLGAVRHHGRAHGYMVRNDLEYWGAHDWANTKPGSIYHALKQMAKQGLLLAHDVAPSVAGGPPRVEYEVTDEGEEAFFALLRESLSDWKPKLDLLSAAIGFIVELPREEVIALLKQRLAGLEGWRTSVTEYYTPAEGPASLGHIGEIMELWVTTADDGLEWTRGLIQRLEAGSYVMAGEGETFKGVLPEGAENPYATGPHPGDEAAGGPRKGD